jgi:hypothetical protein
MALAFRFRLLVPPLIAAAALAVGLFVSWTLAERASALTEDVQVGHVPAVQITRDLEDLLARTQAKLEEAAGTEDEAALAAADQVRAAFAEKIALLRQNRAADDERAAQVGKAYDAYYVLARETTGQLMRQVRGEAVTDALKRMTAGYAATKELLAAESTRARDAMEAAFRTTRDLQRTSVRVTFAAIVGALVLLGWMVAGMVLRLRSMNRTLAEAAERLSAAAAGLSNVTQSSSARLQQQAAEIVEAGATTRQVAETSELAARQAEAVLDVARRAAEFSTSGEASARQGLEGIERMRKQVESIVETSGGLAEKARQVVEINASVQQIAHQSNLLSLNALIEAARAGESGASFAVVAREVRALADRSKDAAERIGAMLADIEAAVRSTVDSTREGRDGLERSVREVVSSAESLRQLGRIMEETSAAATQIAGAVKQQTTSISQITATVGSLDAGMGETVNGMQDVDRAASDLHGTAERIGAVVREFRI